MPHSPDLTFVTAKHAVPVFCGHFLVHALGAMLADVARTPLYLCACARALGEGGVASTWPLGISLGHRPRVGIGSGNETTLAHAHVFSWVN